MSGDVYVSPPDPPNPYDKDEPWTPEREAEAMEEYFEYQELKRARAEKEQPNL